MVLCKPDQQGLHKWKHNYIQVQKPTNKTDDSANPCHDKLISQLQFILKIKNPETTNNGGKSAKYTDALLELMRLQNKNALNKITSMIEMQPQPMEMDGNLRTLKALHIFTLDTILKNIYIVLNSEKKFYVNNYSNQNSYNILYNENFINIDTKKAIQYRKSLKHEL